MKLLAILTTGLILLASCNNSTKVASSSSDSTNKMMNTSQNKEDKEQRNIQTAKDLMKGINDHNSDEAFKNTDPNIVDYGDGSMEPAKSMDSVKKMVNIFFQAFPDFKGEDFQYIADGNKVAIVGDWSGTFKNDMMGMKATGKSFKFKDVDIFTFNDEGKITEHRSIYPMAYMITGPQENKKK
jgi:predicted ester cyclase